MSIDLFNTVIATHGKMDLRIYRQVFDWFDGHAVTDIDTILDHYLELYLDLSKPSRRT